MDLRVSTQTIVNKSIYYEQQQTAALGRLQEQASSGNRILSPEDDPLGSVAVSNYGTQIAHYDTDLTNISTATDSLNVSVSTLQNVNNILTQARQLAIQGGNPGYDASSLSALGDQVDALYQQLVAAANTQNNGHYIFGGTQTQTTPFVTNAQGNVSYAGGTAAASVPVGSSQSVNTYYAGSAIFQPPGNGVTVYTGNTGAQPGTGIDTATGQGTLTVRHTATSFGGLSGVAAGTGSATGDTILGPAGANTLTIDSTAGTVSLNGGPAVAFTNADQNLQVTGPSGEVVFVDTTNIAAGFSGTVPITADGTLSVGNGPAVAINFSGNQVVTGLDGTTTNVNSTNIRQAGSASLTYGGALDAFQVLQGIRDDLLNTRNLSSSAQLKSLSNRLGQLAAVSDNVLRVAGQQSASLQNLTGLQGQIQDVQLQTKQLSGNISSADMASVLTNLQAEQNLLQATLATTARVLSQSLLDFIK
jgi:flagellar hook-associated protein 3 FlgL